MFIPSQNYRNQNQNQNQNYLRPLSNQERSNFHFDPIHIPYSQLLPHLIQNSLVVPRPLKLFEPPFPHWYNLNAKCKFHVGIVGHYVKDCWEFKSKVQDLINNESLAFKKDGPNVKNNHFPKHNGPFVNAIK